MNIDLKKLQETWKNEPAMLLHEPEPSHMKNVYFKDKSVCVILSDEFTFKDEWVVFRHKNKNVCMFNIKDVERVF